MSTFNYTGLAPLALIIFLLWSWACYATGRGFAKRTHDRDYRRGFDQAVKEERLKYMTHDRQWRAKLDKLRLDVTSECLVKGHELGFAEGYEAGSRETMDHIRNLIVNFLREQAKSLGATLCIECAKHACQSDYSRTLDADKSASASGN